MQITLSVGETQALLKRLKPAVNLRSGLPALTTVRFEKADTLTATTSDLELTLTSGVNGEADQTGVVLVPFKVLNKFVSVLPKQDLLTISTDPDPKQHNITLSSDPFFMAVPSHDPDEFPRLGSEFKGKKGKIDFTAVNAVMGAVSNDDYRPILTGIYVTGNEYVATDSYRLYVCKSPTDSKITALIPNRALRALPKWEGVHDIRIGDRAAMIEAEGFRMETRLIDGDYPNYRGLIPAYDHTLIEFDDPHFKDRLTRMTKMSRTLVDDSTPMIFDQGSPVNVQIGRVTPGGDREPTMSTLIPGKSTTRVAYNPKYLTDALNGADVDRLVGVDAMKPMVIRWDSDGYSHERLLMPIRTH